VSSLLNEDSLLQTLPNASNAVERILNMDFWVDGVGAVGLRYTAPFGGAHNVFYKEDLRLTNWIYKGALAVDDLDWYGEWFDSPTHRTGFYMVESTRTTKPYSSDPTVSDILEIRSPYFDPWDTTRWAGSQRQLQNHLNDNYTYRLTTTIPVVSSGLVL